MYTKLIDAFDGVVLISSRRMNEYKQMNEWMNERMNDGLTDWLNE